MRTEKKSRQRCSACEAHRLPLFSSYNALGVGLLGNLNVMDTPFSQTNYTAKLIQDQQARTIADVMFNDPSVRVKTPNGNGVDGLYIRKRRSRPHRR